LWLLFLTLDVGVASILRGLPAGATKPSRVTEDEALSIIPRAAASAYLLKKDASALAAVNDVYQGAKADRDLLLLDCEVEKDELGLQVKAVHTEFLNAETRYSKTQTLLQDLTGRITATQAEIEIIQQTYNSQRSACNETRIRGREQLASVQKDLPVAASLYQAAVQACSGGIPPLLLQCNFTNGTSVYKFKDAALQKQVTTMSGIGGKFISMGLERAVRGAKSFQAASFLELSEFHQEDSGMKTVMHVKKRHHQKQHGELQCAATQDKPSCDALVDSMATVQGNVRDAADELRLRLAKADKNCEQIRAAKTVDMRDTRERLDDFNTMLADASAQSTVDATALNSKEEEYKEIKGAVDKGVGACWAKMKRVENTIEAAMKLREEIFKADSSLEGKVKECEVTKWIRGPCSASCNGGVQTLKREVIAKPSADAKCPVLEVTRKCNMRACPVDCKMTQFGPWSQCTKSCGGGVQTRSRTIEQAPLHGGMPCGETVVQRVCGVKSCDEDCKLASWTAWTGCTKQCNRGHQERYRHVARSTIGQGSCPSAISLERRQLRHCNPDKCKEKIKCDEKTERDVVLVLDSSGSVGITGFEMIKKYAVEVVTALPVKTNVTHLGVVVYGTNATAAQMLTDKQADALSTINGLTWLKGGTNLAAALSLARQMVRTGRCTVPATVIVVTDGMPMRKLLASTEVSRLKEKARLYFATVGLAVNKGIYKQWSSWPPSENFWNVANFGGLMTHVNTTVADICPKVVDA